MEGLTGPAVNLTLCIKEGRGFGFLQNPIVIVARLNCNTLETNIYPPIAEPQFHEELLWETDKQTLRRLRTGKVPVKVECFTTTRQNQRLKVGTVLLDLRSAHIVAKGCPVRSAPEAWHKMQCGSGRCPEMLLCLRVEDAHESLATVAPTANTVKSQQGSTCSTAGPSPNQSERMTQHDALLQVGPLMMATDLFQVTVCVDCSENLSAFKMWSDVNFTCNVFGTDVTSGFFTQDGRAESVLSVRSSLHFLREHLSNKPALWIRLAVDGQELGRAQADICKLVPTESLPDFLERHADTNKAVELKQRCAVVGDQTRQSAGSEHFADVSIRLQLCRPDGGREERRRPWLAAAGDGETTPTHQTLPPSTVLQEPASGKPFQEPATGKPFQEPATGKPFQEPATGKPFQEPATGKPFQEPASGKPFQEPATGKPFQEPASGKPFQEQASGKLFQEPASGKPFQEPASGKPFQEQASGKLFQEPASGKPFQEQASGKLFQEPASGKPFQEQASGKLFQEPASGKPFQEPASGKPFQEPATCQPPVKEPACTSDSRLLNVGAQPCSAPALVASEPALGRREFRAFALAVTLQSVQLHRRPAGARSLRFALRHPQATPIADGLGEVEVPEPGVISALPGFACRLHFVTTPQEIGRLLLAFPPNVLVESCGAGSVWTALGHAALDTARLLAERRRIIFPAPLVDAQGAEAGVLYVSLDLEDDGVRLERGRRVGPAVLDERIAHEAVEELEEWKERQQQHFLKQLLKKESDHLEQLSADFQRRNADRELRLELSVKQSAELADRLEREAGASAARSAALGLRGEQLEQRFRAQVQVLREASTRMQDDLLHKAGLTENKCQELLSTVERLEKENSALRSCLADRDKELFSSNLTQQQTASILQDMRLLEEKLDEATRCKAYFKEQWLQVARELHTLKTEHHTQMQMQIRDSKQSIQALGFQRLLNKEAEELSSDQQLLQQLKADLRNEFSSENATNGSKLSANFKEAAELQQREADQLLHSLIDERDLLLRSGRFGLDDSAVDKINRQIRSKTGLT